VTPVTAAAPIPAHTEAVPIKSYIAWPLPGKAAELQSQLLQIPGCQVLPAENRELLLLITDTPSEPAEKLLAAQLEAITDIQCLSLVAGISEEDAA
jgi:hypothetical protein